MRPLDQTTSSNAPYIDIPQLRLSPNEVSNISTSPQAIHDLAVRLVAALQAYPHFTVLRGVAPTKDRSLTLELARAIVDLEPTKGSKTPEQPAKVHVTRIHVDPERAAGAEVGTRFSRTNQSIEPHTDWSYKTRPPELVAFQMVRPDPVGGDLSVTPIEHVLEALDDDVIEILKRRQMPFGRSPLPVLWEKKGKPCIRYYRQQIESGRKEDSGLTDDDIAALDSIDQVLSRPELSFQFHVEAGDTVYLHNTKALHGRTAFSPNSKRLMFRFRANAGCLS